jgi:predicted phosphodiesterase
VRALVLSDIHGNIDALRALETFWGTRLRDFDQIICLGDLVDYGPNPGDVIDWVRSHATHVVRGNHDHAVATGESCRSAPAFLEASVLTRLRLQPTLTESQIGYLSGLPLTDTITEMGLNGGSPLHLVHACPSDPLYAYMPPQRTDAQWLAALDGTNGETVLIGHTHLAFARPVGRGLVINPGSLGMPKDGNPHGSYAVLDGASVQFCRIAYDPEPVIARLHGLNLPAHVFDQLAETFRTGT